MNDTEPQFVTLHEIIRAARERLNANIWDYVMGGSETETTVLRNRHALDCLAFRPRVLANVAEVNPSGRFFSHRTRLPIFLAPVGSLGSLHAGGGAAAARAAAEAGVPIFVSSVTPTELEAVAAVPSCLKAYQLYPRGDDAWIDDYASRAIAAGYDAFCFTVDNAVTSRRERDIAKRFAKPWRKGAKGLDMQAAFGWDSIGRFRARHRIPLIIKGIATEEDARRACDLGVDAIYVSNHGGRQLDHGRGAIDVLPEVVAAVAGRARVFIDGGFCRGTDIVKAMILGADAVGIGRMYLFGLAAAGAEGVLQVLRLLEEEVAACLALLGVRSIDALDRSSLHAAPAVAMPGLFSAFPLLRLEELRY